MIMLAIYCIKFIGITTNKCRWNSRTSVGKVVDTLFVFLWDLSHCWLQ